MVQVVVILDLLILVNLTLHPNPFFIFLLFLRATRLALWFYPDIHFIIVCRCRLTEKCLLRRSLRLSFALTLSLLVPSLATRISDIIDFWKFYEIFLLIYWFCFEWSCLQRYCCCFILCVNAFLDFRLLFFSCLEKDWRMDWGCE